MSCYNERMSSGPPGQEPLRHEITLFDQIRLGVNAISASIPVAASIAQAWDAYEGRLHRERVSEFFEALSEELVVVKDRLEHLERRVNVAEELPGLIEAAALKARREPIAEKRRCYARALVRSLISVVPMSYVDRLTMLDSLEVLSLTDLRVLGIFRDQLPIGVGDVLEKALTAADLRDIGILISSLSKLAARGLISETSREKGDEALAWSQDRPHWQERWRAKFFEILPQGVLFLKIVRIDDAPGSATQE